MLRFGRLVTLCERCFKESKRKDMCFRGRWNIIIKKENLTKVSNGGNQVYGRLVIFSFCLVPFLPPRLSGKGILVLVAFHQNVHWIFIRVLLFSISTLPGIWMEYVSCMIIESDIWDFHSLTHSDKKNVPSVEKNKMKERCTGEAGIKYSCMHSL